MRFIPTRVHGMMDYLMAIVVATMPWWSGNNRGGAETWVPVAVGAGMALYSLMTDYELGVARKIPMGVHLALDMGGGALLAASPWLFGFSDLNTTPYVVLGVVEVLTALCTRTVPDRSTHGIDSGAPMAGGRRL